MIDFTVISSADVTQWVAVILALVASLLTLYNAAKLKTGLLAVSTYAFGAGMMLLALAFFLKAIPPWNSEETMSLINNLLFIFGFILLGFGSFKIFTMSRLS